MRKNRIAFPAMLVLLSTLAGCAGPTSSPAAPTGISALPATDAIASSTETSVSGGQTVTQYTPPVPTFSNPTNVTNRYCPKSRIAHLVMMGEEEGLPLRTEEMLLPVTRPIEWGGGTVESIVIQYIAYVDGQLIETAFDFYAQDDAGNLWYLGEEVTNYADGQIRDYDGTWLTGRDGAPPGIYVLANPKVGMIFYPEYRPGLVLEMDEVLTLSREVMTPRGLSMEGMHIRETLMDGVVEFKTWAPNYCDVLIEASDEMAQTVWVNYTTDEHRAVPEPLARIERGAEAIFDGASTGNWRGVSQEAQNMQSAWGEYLAVDIEEFVPIAFQDAMDQALQELQAAVADEDAPAARQAANNVSFAAVDLHLYYNPSIPTDLGRMRALEHQVLIDVEARDLSAALDTLAQATAIWTRLRPFILSQDGVDASLPFEMSLNAQVAAVVNENIDAIVNEVANGLRLVDVMEALF